MKNILALGCKDKRGYVVVTDVLCFNFPEMTQEELGALSWKLTQWGNELRVKRKTEDEEGFKQLVKVMNER